MMYRRKEKENKKEEGLQDRLLKAMYGCAAGRFLMGCLASPLVSRAAGYFLDSYASCCLIPLFIRVNKLVLSPCCRKEIGEYRSFNDFFTREYRRETRPVDPDPDHLVSPCDAKASVYAIGEDTSFEIKHTRYTVEELLKSRRLAKRFRGGYALILRLCVSDYHRYIYPLSGEKTKNYRIPGILHTVNPAAVETGIVFKENTREFTLIRNQQFGIVLQMEVGALLVGRICNYHEAGYVNRGEEKGLFEYGGSTIVLLLQKDSAIIREDLLKRTGRGEETPVKQGEFLGEKQVK